MKIIKTLLAVALLSIAGTAYSRDKAYYDAFSVGISSVVANTYITSIETREGGQHAIYISGSYGTSEGCTLSDRAIIDSASAAAKEVYAAALSASLNGTKVRIVTFGCADILGSLGITAPKIMNLQIITPVVP